MYWGTCQALLCCVLAISLCTSGAVSVFNPPVSPDVVTGAFDDECPYGEAVSSVFPVFGQMINYYRVCVNGYMSLPLDAPGVDAFTDTPSDTVILAPYNIDLQLRVGEGSIQVKQVDTNVAEIDDLISHHWQSGYISTINLYSTWSDVPPPFSSSATNTFQTVVTSDGESTYVIYSYDNLNAPNAKIGFRSSNGETYLLDPPSSSADSVLMSESTNSGKPGVWIFKISGSTVYDYCGTHQPCSKPPNLCRNIGDETWKCTCAEGFAFQVIDGKDRCIDINECTGSPCELGTCENTIGSYTCVCPSGYTAHESIPNACEDVNECALNPCGDAPQYRCDNTEGSFRCACADGYEPDLGGCVDVNECDRFACNTKPNTECSNKPGGYECNCLAGFNPAADGNGCIDTNECDAEVDPCTEDRRVCSNIFGSYDCVCAPGFQLEEGSSRCIAHPDCLDMTTGFILDSVGRSFMLVNPDTVSSDPVNLRLIATSEACQMVQANMTRYNTPQHYQVLPFTTHSPDFLIIDETTPMPHGVSSNRSVDLSASSELYMHAFYQKNGVISSFLLFPVDVLDRLYILNTPASGLGTMTDVIIAALDTVTSITVKLPPAVTVANTRRSERSIGSGGMFNFVLNPRETYRFSVEDLDLTGAQILGVRAFAVYITVTDTTHGRSRSHQVPPQNTRGYQYLLTEFYQTTRFVSTQSFTDLTFGSSTHLLVQDGDFIDINGYVGVVTSSKPVSAVAVSTQPSGAVMEELLFPLESVMTESYMFSTIDPSVTGPLALRLVVVTHSLFHKDVLLNGLPLHSYDPDAVWVDIPDTLFCYAVVHGIPAGVHRVSHPAPEVGFLASLYGYNPDTNETLYTYPVGASLKNLMCSVSSMAVSDHKDNDCDGRVDEEICGDDLDSDGDGLMNEDCESQVAYVPPNLNPTPELLTKTCCHGSTCELDCGPDRTVRILHAYYGRINAIDERTCDIHVDEELVCGYADYTKTWMDSCDDRHGCSLIVSYILFNMSSVCTRRSLYTTVDYLCVVPEDKECTIPAVRNVISHHGREEQQFVASHPPAQPAYAQWEVLSHHGNEGLETSHYTHLHLLGDPEEGCLAEFANPASGLAEWCSDEVDWHGAYIQVYIDGPYRITNVLLQKARPEPYWITAFSLQYSSDEQGQLWKTVKHSNGTTKMFPGITHGQHTVLVPLGSYAFTARYIRVVVEGYHRYPALRVDFLRCKSVDGCQHLTLENTDIAHRSGARLETYLVNCYPGYLTPRNSRSFIVTCDNGGEWQNIQPCSEIHCGPFRQPNGLAGLPQQALPFLDNFRYLGESGTETCHADSTLVGLTQIKCHNHANWTHIPVCEINSKEQCNFPTVDNAIVNVVTSNVGSVAYYKCIPDFEMTSGSNTLSCTQAGTVSGTTPVCTAVV